MQMAALATGLDPPPRSALGSFKRQNRRVTNDHREIGNFPDLDIGVYIPRSFDTSITGTVINCHLVMGYPAGGDFCYRDESRLVIREIKSEGRNIGISKHRRNKYPNTLYYVERVRRCVQNEIIDGIRLD